MVPDVDDMRSQLNQSLIVLADQAQIAHWPVNDAGLNVWIVFKAQFLLDWRLHHREGMPAALIMLMGQHGAANDWQIGIAAHKVVWQLLLDLNQVDQRLLIDLHWFVLGIQENAVFMEVGIW